MHPSPVLKVSESEPTTILRDFEVFIDHLEEHPVTLTRVHMLLPAKTLYELNGRMSRPATCVTEKSTQTLYPLLHLFYHLTLAGKLFQKEWKGKGMANLRPTDRLQMYKELRPTEKYFFLLESFWVDTDWEDSRSRILGGRLLIDATSAMDYISGQKPDVEMPIMGKGRDPEVAELFWSWGYFMLYFSYFGFWNVIPHVEGKRSKLPKRYFLAESITPTKFGVTMASILNSERNFDHWNVPMRLEWGEWRAIPGSPFPGEEWDAGSEKAVELSKSGPSSDGSARGPEHFFLPFVPLFPKGELERTLPREDVRFADGTYLFNVSLANNLWRRIEIGANHTLLDLHRSIQEAFHFDDDHLYSFFMDNKAWSHKRINSPYDDEGPHADEVRVGELDLVDGQRILYLFDFGDEWRFRVELEGIRKEGDRPERPRMVESRGRAPEQYGW